MNFMKQSFILFSVFLICSCTIFAQKMEEYKLVWADEFNTNGRPDTSKWNYEEGFVRNEELQWYQPENAYCKNGLLIIEGRRETKLNPDYDPSGNNWRKSRKNIEYTSACLITKGKQAWQYGRFEMRARIDISQGMWPRGGRWAPKNTGLPMAKLISWNITAECCWPILPVLEMMGNRSGLAIPFRPIHWAVPHGQLNFIPGEWTGQNNTLLYIVMITC